MKRFLLILFAVLLLSLQTSGVQAEDTACAKVTLEIAQELTLERVAFDAKLVLTNNIPDKDLNNIRVDVSIEDGGGNVKDDIFFVRLSSTDNIDSVDGSGTIKAGTKAEVHWLIIPSPGAGGESPNGIAYWAGATLTYTLDGNEDIIPINPDTITVRPTAQLVLDYFMPFDVLADNPFTPEVEAPVPYELAVRVMNDGYGPAANLRIDSAQPEITSNDLGLLVDFQLLGASVNDTAVSPSLTVDMGDVVSKDAATAYWEMISTLSGRFEEFDVSFTHASELGGELTSIIRETNAHYLTHRIKANIPGRDNLLDFLADTDRDEEHLPDAIFESEIPGGSTDIADATSPVTVTLPVIEPPRPTPAEPGVEMSVDLSENPTGWIYTRLPDPSDGMLELLDVIRADGVQLDPNNFWVEEGLDEDYREIYTLQFVDYRVDSGVTGTYTLVYAQPADDTTPPTTTVIFDGPDTGTDPVVITPETRIVLAARDNEGGSGVGEMFRRVVEEGGDFTPALPFNLTTPGTYTLEYYSVDRAGNEEAAKTANIVVDNAEPAIISFEAVPDTFTPHAPRGVVAARSVDFVVSAIDDAGTMQVEIELVDANADVVRTLTGTAESSVELTINWDAKDDDGILVPTGVYTARLSVTDGLDNLVEINAPSHTSTAEVTVTATEWLTETPVSPNTSADQMYPDVSGTRVVWQDKRNGDWDIYMKDLPDGTSMRITQDDSNQERPSVEGDIIVWQDDRSGNWDIYGYDLSKNQEMVISTGTGNQERPVTSGGWVVWQDNRRGNWDVYAKNIITGETIQITSHERDQMRPATSGGTVVWEDYRHGLGEVYTFDLASRIETRVTVEINNQTLPAASGDKLVWTDQRNGQKDIYSYDPARGELKITYGTGAHTQPDVLGDMLIYTDYESGSDDPNLSFQDLSSGVGGRLTSDPAKQEEPELGEGLAVWQDNRDGVYQIYTARLEIEALPIEVGIRPGFNLVAVGQRLVDAHATASSLIDAMKEGIVIEKTLAFDSLHGTYTKASRTTGNFNLTKGMGLVVYAKKKGTIEVADSGEESWYTLLPGTNQIGMLAVPFAYSAYDLMNSVGLDNIQSVRRFDNRVGIWQTVSVRNAENGLEIVGANFTIYSGEGLIITMKQRVDGWRPQGR